MRIVHVVRQFAPAVGGLESFVGELARRQSRAGHDVRVVTLDRVFDGDDAILAPLDRMGEVEVRRLRWFGSRRYPIALGVLGAIKGADIVHVHALDSFFDALSLTRPLHRLPMVFSTHGLFFHTPFASRAKLLWFNTLTRVLASGYRAVLASSEQDAERFSKIRARGVVTLENGVDLDKFADVVTSDNKRIIYFGRLAPNKGIDRLLTWFVRLAEQDDGWSLTIAGKPMGIPIEGITSKAAALGLSARVAVHDTPSDDELRALIATASVYVCASSYEGFGLAAVEAASAGLFLALSPIPPFRRNLAQIGYGTLVDFDDPDSATGFLAAWRARGSRLPAEALEQQFGWSKVVPSIDRLYGCVTGRIDRCIGTTKTAVITADEAIARIHSRILERRGGIVMFTNHHLVNNAVRHPEITTLFNDAIALPDGIALDVASRILYGTMFPENLNGTDFFPKLLNALPPTRIFLIGSAAGVAEQAQLRLAELFPTHSFVGSHHGYPTAEQSLTIVEEINSLNAEIVVVGMGNPHQELWMSRYGKHLNAVGVCGGALLDRYAGLVQRGPAWLSRWRLEWLYRIIQEPRRMSRRYITGGVAFMSLVLRQKIAGYRV